MYSDMQKRELFHFAFLERFLKITDPNFYSLKGGANLRFFFKSPRYSEDMDLDVFGGSVETLKKNGYKILEDGSFQKFLLNYGIRGIEIGDKNKAKHTDTVQRFKVNLLTESGVRLPTKVEYSRRKSDRELVKIERVNSEIAKNFSRLGYLCPHYPVDSAFIQKIGALAGRSETQARDLFDLEILNSEQGINQLFIRKNISLEIIHKAIEKAETINYEDFNGQVFEYILEEKKDSYKGKKKWEILKSKVLELLYEFA
jgi:predicted nucleotidyltransferase component of viral defense system